MIRTVCGDIRPEELGFCDTHSHVFVSSEYLLANFPDYVFAFDNYPLMVQELRDYYDAGGRALLDAQPVGTGRRALMMQQASQETGVHIVACTGFHQECFYPEDHWIYRYTQEQLAQLYIQELTVGMYDYAESCEPGFQTDARAGCIKAATTQPELSAHILKLLGAVAQACKATGAPIICHTENQSDLTTIGFLLDQGVPRDSIIIAHTDRIHNDPPRSFDRAEALGTWFAIDTFVPAGYQEEDKVRQVTGQLELGRGSRMLLGLDPTRPLIGTMGGVFGFTYLPSVFSDALRNAGVTRQQLRQITVVNPALALDWKT